jgi:hypothetical protein
MTQRGYGEKLSGGGHGCWGGGGGRGPSYCVVDVDFIR